MSNVVNKVAEALVEAATALDIDIPDSVTVSGDMVPGGVQEVPVS